MRGVVLATANVEGTITHCDAKTGRSIHTIKDEDAHFLGMDFSHDGKWLAAGATDGCVRIYNE